jgi:transportin-1
LLPHSILQAVFKLATDESSGVRREVCIAFCQLVAVHPELLQAHLPQLVEYMLVSNQVRNFAITLA